MASTITAATLDAKAIVVILIILFILVMGFDFDNLLGRE